MTLTVCLPVCLSVPTATALFVGRFSAGWGGGGSHLFTQRLIWLQLCQHSSCLSFRLCFFFFLFSFYFQGGCLLGSSGSGTTQSSLFPCCLSLLSPRCVFPAVRREVSAIKSPFLLPPPCVWPPRRSARCSALRSGEGLLWLLVVGEGGGALCGTQAIVLREVTGRSDPKSMRKQQLAPLRAPFSAEQQLRGDR